MKPGKILSMFFAIVIAMTSLAMISTNLHAATGEGAFTITLAADKTSALQGDTIVYTYTLNNGTSENITGIIVNDSKFGAISLPATTLNVSENMTATFAYTILASDLPGPLVNTATAQGTNSVSENLTATSNQVSVALAEVEEGELTIALAANKTSASQGDTITYTYTLNNSTSDNITGVIVNDSKFGAVSLPATTLSPSGSITATFTYIVLASDLPGPLVNTATAQGTNSASENLSATSNQVSVALTTNEDRPMTKAEILKSRGVPGKGLDTAPGLQKYFNSNSQAANNAGKKTNKENNGKQNGKNNGQDDETDD